MYCFSKTETVNATQTKTLDRGRDGNNQIEPLKPVVQPDFGCSVFAELIRTIQMGNYLNRFVLETIQKFRL